MNKILSIIFLLTIVVNTYAQPNWAEDISCIVYSHCSSCHNSEGIGPFNLMNYQDAFNNRYSMQSAIENRTMPPWPPNQEYAPFAHANVLSDTEIALFQEWVNNGAPEGDPMLSPEPPVIEHGGFMQEFDLELTTELFTVPSGNEDLYKCFVIPTAWGEDKFINEIEVYPNNRNIVHHVLVYKNDTDDPIIDDANDPAIGFECGGSIEGGNNVLMGEWVPGSRPWKMPEGTGVKMKEGTNILMQVHYPEGSEGQSDFITIKIKFTPTNVGIREVFQDQTLDHIDDLVDDFALVILPYETKTFHEKYVLPEARTFIAASPHAHLVCTKMWSYAILPNGEQINMVEIPNWDFDWQGFYHYPEPIILPAGTELHGYARYVNNPNENPNISNPPGLVTIGEATTDEMMLFFYSYLYYEPGDENLILPGDGTHINHFNNCSEDITPLQHIEESVVSFYPNPVESDKFQVTIGNQIQGNYSIEISDISGKKILSNTCNGNCEITLPNSFSNGVYFARIIQDGKAIGEAGKLLVLR